MVDERWDLQVQAGTESDKRIFQVVLEDADLQMEGGCWSGQFGCRQEEGRSEMESRDRSKMEGTEALDELEPMGDKSRCVLGKEVEGPDRA